ncbi:MAG: BolA family transcriptional regulator [Pseudomonadota bacterium]|nr:BolA family transcriptional regulator [Pseudomonadota bacterium]
MSTPNKTGWVTAEQIRSCLEAALAPTHLQVEDDSHLHAGHAGAREGGHFTVRLTSARFEGLSRVARHRLVYDSLGSLAEQGVHALAIVATAPLAQPGAAAPSTSPHLRTHPQ